MSFSLFSCSQGPDHPHSLSYKLELGSDQEIPSDWYPFATVQFVVPDACASGTEVKSLGIENDVQPQKHVIQKACFNCQVFWGGGVSLFFNQMGSIFEYLNTICIIV